MKSPKIFLFVPLILFGIIISCSEEPIQPTAALTEDNYVYIVNEGTYTWGNGSISAYSPEKKTVILNVFENANGIKLGDVPQSINFYNNQAFICVNNSKKIQAVSLPDFKLIATFTEPVSPRYMAINKEGIGYVSDLYDKKISIFNLKTKNSIGAINAGKTTENLLITEKLLIASNWSFGKTVQFFDLNTQNLIKEIEVGLEPNSMIIDKEKHLWVLCSGGFNHAENPKLNKIDLDTYEIERILVFENKTSSPTRLCLSNDSSSLYYLNSGIYKYSINNENLPAKPFIEAAIKNFYGLAICPNSGDIYVSDAKDFVSKSKVYRYSNEGTLIDNFEAGIGAGGFGFYKLK